MAIAVVRQEYQGGHPAAAAFEKAPETILFQVGHGGDFNKNSLVTLLDLDGTKVLLMGGRRGGRTG